MYKFAVAVAALLAVAAAKPGIAPVAYTAPVASYAGSYLPSTYGYGYGYGLPSTYAYSPLSYSSVAAPLTYSSAYSAYPGYSVYPSYYSGLSGYSAYSPLNYNSYWNPSSLYWKKK